MDYITIIGSIASILTTTAFVPQALKTWRTKSAKDLSLAMFLTFFLGVCLWFVYGLLLGEWPIILGNIFTMVFSALILYVKLRYG
jgi:MtN3 and saliva related transmembrane protein